MSAPRNRELVGTLGTYSLTSELGSGGNAKVWRAAGPTGDVAVKILNRRPPPDGQPRFIREIKALERLKEVPGVLPILDTPEPDPTHDPEWFAMPIAKLLKEELGPEATLREICDAVSEIASCLSRVHDLGIAHRDIKPNNLYFYKSQWCIGDFGLVSLPDAEPITGNNKKLGPVYYIAPEMLNDPKTADGKPADVYSLGKTLWVLATGQTYPLPGVHEPTNAAFAIGSYQDDARCAELDELIRRMTLSVSTRRPSAKDVAGELRTFTKTPPPRAASDPSDSFRRLRAVAAPHENAREERHQQQEIASESMRRINQSIGEIVRLVEKETGLLQSHWSPPTSWGHRESISSPQVTWSTDTGAAFSVTSNTFTWRLGIGARCQLLSDGDFFLHVGFDFDRRFGSHSANLVSQPHGWEDSGSAPNGTPSARALEDRLLQGMGDNLPSVIDAFTRGIDH